MLQLTVIGNLGADAEVKEANGNKFVSFNVAHTDRWVDADGTVHESTQWVGCALSGDGGNLLQYLRKGTTVFVLGRLRTRVYSSEKARGFVAGLDLSVQHIELVGGKADEVPSRLFDREGKQVDISKHFWTQMAEYYGTQVFDRSGKAYTIDAQGWVAPIQVDAQPTPEESAAQTDAPFEVDADPLSQKVKRTRKK